MLKKYLLGLSLLSYSMFSFAVDKLTTDEQKQSYSIGYNFASSIKSRGVTLDTEALLKGINAVSGEDKALMTDEEMAKTLQNLSLLMQKKQAEQSSVEGKVNLEKGKKYLDDNRKIAGIIETKSGLQYKYLTKGKGTKPSSTDKVKVHYKGTFINGDEFDSSYKRGTPAVFALNQVIKGWTEVLQLIPVGSKIEVTIPSNLAYGKNARSSIGSNRLLIFIIELISIES